ncbi:hypothetical protein BT96DRAFT_986827 [Gymnopus androsaceus JB14]|uniref:Uncharacterized protein n=1 Tax=Gymnopus androsaceus JB14 TaxID=1447944 RepID=A0A6A4ID65_9AGAR|nr:hypothetical protein BT96DRAFT_986827 [Gymnopus androsaceus JB14]
MKCPFTEDEIKYKQQCREFIQKNLSGPLSFMLKTVTMLQKLRTQSLLLICSKSTGDWSTLSNNVTLDKVVIPKLSGTILIADAVIGLRDKVNPLGNSKVTPLVDIVNDLADSLKTRFQRAAGMEAELSHLTDIVFTLGDFSARDI